MMSKEPQTLRGREFVAMWIVAAAVAVPVLMWMFDAIRDLDVPQSQAFIEYNEPRVQEFRAATANGAIGVVVMGDSRTRYATDLQENLTGQLSEELGEDVAVLRLTNDWASYSDFVAFMPTILEADPALVVLQEELRLKNQGYDASEAIKRKYLWWKLLGRGVWDPGESDQVWYQEENTCEAIGVQELDVRLRRLSTWVNYDEAGEAAVLVKGLEEELEQAGITLRFLDVPVSTDAAAVLPGVELTEGPAGLSPDFVTDDSLYCDYVHMDPTARAAYNDWFVTTIADELTDLERHHDRDQ